MPDDRTEATNPAALTPEARDALLYAAVQYLVEAEQRRQTDRGYLRSLAESQVVGGVRLDQLAALLAIAAIAGALGLSGPQVWAIATGAPAAP